MSQLQRIQETREALIDALAERNWMPSASWIRPAGCVSRMCWTKRHWTRLFCAKIWRGYWWCIACCWRRLLMSARQSLSRWGRSTKQKMRQRFTIYSVKA